jgi:hypothetical protein
MSDFLNDWPMERPQPWIEFVHEPDKAEGWMTYGPALSVVDRLEVKLE